MTKSDAIGGIIDIMKSCWDLPADCNEGELFAYAEMLFDRIDADEDSDALCAYLADVQTNKLEMPASDASKEIVARSIALVKFDSQSHAI